MTRTQKNLILLVAAVVLAVAGGLTYLRSSPSVSQPTAPLKIELGAILPLTGQSAFLGEREKLGIELAADTLNQAGGIGGQSISILYGDSQNQAREAIAEYRKLWQVQRVRGLIVAHSAVAGAISSLMKDQPPENLPVVLGIMSNATYITQNSPMIFRCYPTGAQEAKPMARFAYGDLGLRRIAFYVQNDDYGLDGQQTFEREFTGLGGRVVAAETFEKDAKDHRSSLQKLKAAAPDGIYLIGNVPAYGSAFRQLREQGISVPLLTGSAFGVKQFQDLAGAAAEGVYATTTLFDSPLRYDRPTSRQFIDRFRERHGSEPGFLEAFSYSAMMILAQGLSAAGPNPSPGDLQRALSASGKIYDLPIGEIRFNADRNAELPLELQIFTGGGFAPAKPAASLRPAA